MIKSLDDWLKKITKESVPGIQLGLDRCKELLLSLDCLKNIKHVITVGGTNGKGSSVAMLEAIMLEYGYKVGTYTSPHIHKINERIKINGIEITDNQLILSFDKIAENKKSSDLTFFEYLTLAAIYFFSLQKLDVIILEVGLGGRLDAVNCIDADIALISAIDIDHTEFLGESREQIGFEKAGIMRKRRHAVCSDDNVPNSILGFAEDNEVNLHILGVDFHMRGGATSWQWWTDNMMIEGNYNSLVKTNCQLRNLSGALKVLELSGFELKSERIQKALDAVSLRGRFQILRHNNREWVIDVAHNNQACVNLVESVKKLPATGNNLGLFGLQKTKHLQKFFSPLVSLVDLWFLPNFDEETFWPVSEIKEVLKRLGVSPTNIFAFNSTSDALDAIKLRRDEERVLVAGSFIVVKNVLEEIEAR